jgi:hypothetical protein
MAKSRKKGRKAGRKSGRLTKREIAKAGGIKQAWAARKHGKAGRKTARKAHRTAKQKAAARRNIKKAQAKSHPKRRKARKGGHRKARKSSRRRGRKSTRSASRSSTKVIKSTVVRHLPGHTSAIVVSPIGTSGRGKRRGRKGKGKRRGSHRRTGRKGKRGKGRRKGGRKARESYALENPLSAFELGLGLFTGALGFGVSDFVDRFLATHALAASATVSGANGDTPPTTGDYKGLFNATAVLAPMNLPRWGAGVGLAAVPFIAAAFVKAPAGRSALQMFGFGAAMRTLGKGLTDLVAQIGPSQTIVQRLYDGEARAAALKAEGQGTTPTVASASLPSSGLGKAALCSTGCGRPTTGAGSCCSACASKQQSAPTTNAAPPPPPPPPPTASLPLPTNTPYVPVMTSLQGTPKVPAKKSPYDWGYKGDDASGE